MRSGANMGPEILAVITARGGSKGLPGKNIRPLGGKPLIAYTIEAALGSGLITKTIVSTDDPKIAAVSKEFGADAPFLRPADLAKDTTPSLPVVRHAVEFMENAEGKRFDFIILLQPTSPFRSADDIDGALEKLIKTGADSVISMCRVEDMHPMKLKKIENDRILPYMAEEPEGIRRQDLPPVYMRNGAIYAVRRGVLMERSTLYGGDSRPYIMPQEASVNIDSPLDFAVAEALLNSKKPKGSKEGACLKPV